MIKKVNANDFISYKLAPLAKLMAVAPIFKYLEYYTIHIVWGMI
jgi:hypothetical protein